MTLTCKPKCLIKVSHPKPWHSTFLYDIQRFWWMTDIMLHSTFLCTDGCIQYSILIMQTRPSRKRLQTQQRTLHSACNTKVMGSSPAATIINNSCCVASWIQWKSYYTSVTLLNKPNCYFTDSHLDISPRIRIAFLCNYSKISSEPDQLLKDFVA